MSLHLGWPALHPHSHPICSILLPPLHVIVFSLSALPVMIKHNGLSPRTVLQTQCQTLRRISSFNLHIKSVKKVFYYLLFKEEGPEVQGLWIISSRAGIQSPGCLTLNLCSHATSPLQTVSTKAGMVSFIHSFNQIY